MDIIWFIEHVDRELDVACSVKSIVESKSSIHIHIKHMYLDLDRLLRNAPEPDMMVFPFFYNCNNNAQRQYIEKWKNTTVFNLSWEELYYNAHAVIKAPGDDFTKKQVLHHAWGDFFKDYLMHYGVTEKNIFVNGQPAYKLYEEPYRNYFKNRDALSVQFNLDLGKKWIFIPENFKWAFLADSQLADAIKAGADESDVALMKKFCQESLEALIQWCVAEAESNEDIEIIFRPRPAVNSILMKQFITTKIGKIPPQLKIIKEESVREWILASDTVISSYSTCLIESSIANKNIYMALPKPLPPALWCDWYTHIEKIEDQESFHMACRSTDRSNYSKLGDWARGAMLSHGDPIENLAEYFITYFSGHNKRMDSGRKNYSSDNTRISKHHSNGLFRIYSMLKVNILNLETIEVDSIPSFKKVIFSLYRFTIISLFKVRIPLQKLKKRFEKKGGFNRFVYEKDLLDNNDIEQRCSKWKRIILKGQPE